MWMRTTFAYTNAKYVVHISLVREQMKMFQVYARVYIQCWCELLWSASIVNIWRRVVCVCVCVQTYCLSYIACNRLYVLITPNRNKIDKKMKMWCLENRNLSFIYLTVRYFFFIWRTSLFTYSTCGMYCIYCLVTYEYNEMFIFRLDVNV